ncbi:MAG: sensor histidine kinase, partial [Planctomycetes bacterium]|nr:sensor histidine kinase [Planctomycetota bacterium]
DNACKYASGPGRDVLRIAAERAGGGGALVRIEDEGPGIPPEQAKRLFRPFSKSARDAARSAPGVGLGLALSRRLARTMGGELTLDAASEPGACFVLRLPGA